MLHMLWLSPFGQKNKCKRRRLLRSTKGKIVDRLRQEIEAGQFNTQTLRANWSEILFNVAEGQINQVGHLLSHPIVYCDICGEPSFAIKTKSAYNGAHWVCEEGCVRNYVPC